MRRRDVVRRALGVVGGASVIPLSGQVSHDDGAAPSDADRPSSDARAAGDEPPLQRGPPDRAVLDGPTHDGTPSAGTSPDRTVPDAPRTVDEAVAEGSPALDGGPTETGDDTYEAVAARLRGTHEDRCQCPVCAGSMPGRG
ncbi:MAG: hypothetical protein PPP55_03875 [Halorubrum sp.]